MNGNIRVGSLFGIPFYVNPSWFLVLGLMTLTYGTDLAYQTQLPGILPWILGLITSLLLFSSVLAHELGHSFVAMAQGIEVKSITLFIFGGLAALEKESKTPEQALLVAIAGPLVSVLLFGIFTIIGLNFTLPLALSLIISLLAMINLILAVFNMIPGLPLDGGNVLKAIVWKITGNPQKGVIFAGMVGQFFGWTAIIIGALGTLNVIGFGNFWTVFIGWFLLQNAGNAAQSARMEDKLNHYTAADAILPESPVIQDNLTLREFANNYVIGKQQWRKFLVTNNLGILIGVLNTDDLRSVSTMLWNETLVSDLMKSKAEVKTVIDSLSLLEVAKILEQQQEQELTVVKEDGVVVGLIEKQGIIKFLQSKITTAIS
ncbi:MAG: site-2 protease family protein [Cyanobacteria bacterium]|nr:site-2 protease family protein [Cyanobacteria bacterium CG_2015-16_32_12]NCO78604.1 site-2 protease family protein [Cyanobacteria bacterium CG_2015-22_32_23]NCQ02996.1 site-2 protease family protein [Cyanobacteria bacterium CG_2015-09_32_10]NCQ41780.1 site-2 protease family protein [Cyanobacteria bacterium CG_2015-04_32_10]NCS83687.1 site-2 protease family protein [Cyanobacteria bacterium CG_2015-02_32_10]